MKALVTGAAGFIGSHLTAALLDRGADVVGIDCFTDYYPRAIKQANLDVNAGRQGFRFVEAALQSADLPALLDGRTHVFHLAAQAGVRKSWGSDFRIYTDNNVDATQRLLEACVGRGLQQVRLRVELVGLWRQRHLADDGRRPASARVAVWRDKAGRRAALLSLSCESRGAGHVGALLHRLRAAAASRHGVPSFHSCGAPQREHHALR